MLSGALEALASLSVAECGYAAAVVFVGYLVLGISGFGSALTIVPGLAWHWPLTTVVPLVLLMDLPATLYHAWLNRHEVAWVELRPMLPGMGAGVAVGALIAPWTAHPAALAALGLFVIGAAVRGLSGKAPRARARIERAPVAGAAAGMIESVFGTAGPPVLWWLTRRLSDARRLRATAPMALALVTLLGLVGLAAAGLLGQPLVWAAWLVMLPLAAAGVAIGDRVAQRMGAGSLARLIWMALGLSGAAMLVRAIA